MKNNNNSTNKPLGSDDFLRLGRYIAYDYLNGKILFEEMVTLIWLQLRANPNRGKCKVSYDELAKDLHGLVKNRKKDNRKNFINKIMLALKRKKYIHYTSQQGRRSSFEVLLGNYPLSCGNFTNIENVFPYSEDRSEANNTSNIKAENMAEVGEEKQKLETSIDDVAERYFNNAQTTKSRSLNNENKNNNLIPSDTIKSNDSDVSLEVLDYFPRNSDEKKCKEIALSLKEKDMRFILSCLKKFGINLIEKAYEETVRDFENGISIKNKAAYFNAKIYKLAKKEEVQENEKYFK